MATRRGAATQVTDAGVRTVATVLAVAPAATGAAGLAAPAVTAAAAARGTGVTREATAGEAADHAPRAGAVLVAGTLEPAVASAVTGEGIAAARIAVVTLPTRDQAVPPVRAVG